MENTNYYSNNISLRDFISKTMFIMATGLLITMTVAIVSSKFIDAFFLKYSRLAFLLTILSLIAEIVIVVVLSKRIYKLSKASAYVCFGVYAILNGYNLTYIFTSYSKTSVALTFALCALLFFSMSIIGHTTKVDLLKYSTLIRIGLIALIIGSIICIFVYSSVLNWVMTCAGIVLFLLLVAYDNQKLRNLYNESYSDPELYSKLAIIGALELYLDFINLFIRIISLFGRRRD